MSVKRLSQIILFICVSLFFLLPPLFQSDTMILDFSSAKYYISSTLYCLIAFLILFLAKKTDILSLKVGEKSFKHNKIKVIIDISTVFFATVLLCVISIILQWAATYFGAKQNNAIVFPRNFQWLLCVLCFLFSAFYEEAIYRVFLPESLIAFLGQKLYVISECISCFVFAFSHRYNGIFAVINALFGYAILRYCYKKTNNIFASTIAHFLYNIVQLAVSI